jgi:hypothetical protein
MYTAMMFWHQHFVGACLDKSLYLAFLDLDSSLWDCLRKYGHLVLMYEQITTVAHKTIPMFGHFKEIGSQHNIMKIKSCRKIVDNSILS